MKKYPEFILKRISVDLKSKEKNSEEYRGILLSNSDNYRFAFKIDDSILIMNINCIEHGLIVNQKFKDAVSEISFFKEKKGKYSLVLNNSYNLCFITETTFIKHSENEIHLKYNLYDENTNEIISFNEIIIVGENSLC